MSNNDDRSGRLERAEEWFAKPDRWQWASGVVVLLVVLALIVVLVPGGDEEPAAGTSSSPGSTAPEEAAEQTAPKPSGPSVPSGWADQGCNGSEGAPTVPTKGPEATWKPLGAMSVPVDQQAGPGSVKGPLRRCFQHSPTGALFAAVNIPSAPSQHPAKFVENAVKVLTEQMTPGKGRDEQIRSVKQNPDGAGSASVAGFRFGACAPTQCQITVLSESGGAYLQAAWSLVWTDGDWKLDGTAPVEDPVLTYSEPSGYVGWQPSVSDE